VVHSDFLKKQLIGRKKILSGKDLMRRSTVQSLINCELMILTIDDLEKLKHQFPDIFGELFVNTYHRLRFELQLKLEAIQYCEETESSKRLETGNSSSRFGPFDLYQNQQVTLIQEYVRRT
jgi:CRP-like cAMP-binding protein